MRRRSVLTGALAGLCGLAGCVGTFGLADSGASPRPLPDPPEELTPTSVVEYVTDYEERLTHNVHAEAGASKVTVTANASFDYATDDGYHVTAQHAGTVSHRDTDGGRSVGELYSRPIPYRVTAGETIRADLRRKSVDPEDEGAPKGDEPVEHPLGVRIPNFTDRTRELTVSVIANAGDGNRVIETDVAVESASALELSSIADAPGTYLIVARFAENGVTGEGRISVDLPGVDRGPNVDVRLRSDGVSTRPLPTFDGS